jgi:hypothetical protein
MAHRPLDQYSVLQFYPSSLRILGGTEFKPRDAVLAPSGVSVFVSRRRSSDNSLSISLIMAYCLLRRDGSQEFMHHHGWQCLAQKPRERRIPNDLATLFQ